MPFISHVAGGADAMKMRSVGKTSSHASTGDIVRPLTDYNRELSELALLREINCRRFTRKKYLNAFDINALRLK